MPLFRLAPFINSCFSVKRKRTNSSTKRYHQTQSLMGRLVGKHPCYLSVRVGRIIIKREIPIIASKEYIAASQYIFAVSNKETLCIKTNDCTFAA